MNRQEVAQLLTIDATVTGRTIDEATIIVWHKILEHMPYAETVTALEEHYAESPRWIMPAHLVTRVRQMMQDSRNAETTRRLAIEAPVADLSSLSVQEVHRVLSQMVTEIPKEDWPHPVIDDMTLPKRHACVACKAPVGVGCTIRGINEPMRGYHYSRLVSAGLAEPEKPFDPAELARLIAEYPAQVGESA